MVLLNPYSCGSLLFCPDLDKLDNEKNEMNQTDIAALHHFYSKHLDIPSNAALGELFAQVSYFAVFLSCIRGDYKKAI